MDSAQKSGWVAMLAIALASCSVIDVPVSSASGEGLVQGSSVSVRDDAASRSTLSGRVKQQIEAELTRTGYVLDTAPAYVMEFGIAKRPVAVGIVLPETPVPGPADGQWRARSVETDFLALCDVAVFRLSIVVIHRKSGEVTSRGLSDDDICGLPTDGQLRNLAAATLAQMQAPSISAK